MADNINSTITLDDLKPNNLIKTIISNNNKSLNIINDNIKIILEIAKGIAEIAKTLTAKNILIFKKQIARLTQVIYKFIKPVPQNIIDNSETINILFNNIKNIFNNINEIIQTIKQNDKINILNVIKKTFNSIKKILKYIIKQDELFKYTNSFKIFIENFKNLKDQLIEIFTQLTLIYSEFNNFYIQKSKNDKINILNVIKKTFNSIKKILKYIIKQDELFKYTNSFKIFIENFKNLKDQLIEIFTQLTLIYSEFNNFYIQKSKNDKINILNVIKKTFNSIKKILKYIITQDELFKYTNSFKIFIENFKNLKDQIVEFDKEFKIFKNTFNNIINNFKEVIYIYSELSYILLEYEKQSYNKKTLSILNLILNELTEFNKYIINFNTITTVNTALIPSLLITLNLFKIIMNFLTFFITKGIPKISYLRYIKIKLRLNRLRKIMEKLISFMLSSIVFAVYSLIFITVFPILLLALFLIKKIYISLYSLCKVINKIKFSTLFGALARLALINLLILSIIITGGLFVVLGTIGIALMVLTLPVLSSIALIILFSSIIIILGLLLSAMSSILLSAIVGLGILALVILAINLIAFLLINFAKLNLAEYKQMIILNIAIIGDVILSLITMLINDPINNQNQTKQNKNNIINLLKGLGINIISTLNLLFIFPMIITMLLITGALYCIAYLLKCIADIELNILNIELNITIITNVIDMLMKFLTKNNEQSNESKNTSGLSQIALLFGQSVQLILNSINTMLVFGTVLTTLLIAGGIYLICKLLFEIGNINLSSLEQDITNNLQIIGNITNNLLNYLNQSISNDATSTEKQPNLLQKIGNIISGITGDILNIISNLVAFPMLIQSSIFLGVIYSLSKMINSIATLEIDSTAFKTNIDTIFNCISDISTSNKETLGNININNIDNMNKKLRKYKKATRRLVKISELLPKINELKIDSTVFKNNIDAIFNCISDISTSNKETLGNININNIDNMNKKLRKYKKAIKQLVKISKLLPKIKFRNIKIESNFNIKPIKNILNSILSLLRPLKRIKRNAKTFKAALKSANNIINRLKTLIKEISKLSLNSANSNLDILKNTIKKISKLKLNKNIIKPQVIRNFKKFIKALSDLSKIQNINQAYDTFKNVNKFIDKINSADLTKLNTTYNIFKELANFSKSIHGDFDGLAETLNEKIAPIIEELLNIFKEFSESKNITIPKIQQLNTIDPKLKEPQTNIITPTTNNASTTEIDNIQNIREVLSRLDSMLDLMQISGIRIQTI